jgi:hypothetical protein
MNAHARLDLIVISPQNSTFNFSTPVMRTFGAYIIGDEILSGKRKDAHLSKVIELLNARSLQLS